MKVTIEIEDDLLAAIDKSVEQIGQSRDFAFVTAAKWWLDSAPKIDHWEFDFAEVENDPDREKKIEAYYKEYGW
jgi:metal-responsive CopG/Arc/MetJ family transcriptional regulator